MPAHTPSCAVAAAEDVRQPLAQPALDALGGDDDQFLGERVGQGVGQQGAEAVGEEVGSFSAVQVQAPSGPTIGDRRWQVTASKTFAGISRSRLLGVIRGTLRL